MDIEKEERKPVLLLHSGGFEFYDSLPDTGTTYNSLNTDLSTYFGTKTNKCS